MTTGELDYDGIFRLNSAGESDDASELAFLPVAYILWIPFVIVMPLLFANLLVILYLGYRIQRPCYMVI